MSVTFYRLTDDGYEAIGRVEDGVIVEGTDRLGDLYRRERDGTDEGALIERFNGPYVVAAIDEDGGA